MQGDGEKRALLLNVEAEEGLTFLQSFVVTLDARADLDEVERGIASYLRDRGATLLRLDRDEVVEVSFDRVPEAWSANASPAHGIRACSGRIWIDPSLRDEPSQSEGLFRRILGWFTNRRRRRA